jgi:hypothetical protein
MLKKLAKLLCPSSRKIAESAAQRIQYEYNSVAEGKRAIVAHYASIANEIGEWGQHIAKMLEDGVIDDVERETLISYIEALTNKAKAIVFE